MGNGLGCSYELKRADPELPLVYSANLTGTATEVNMKLGVRVDGGALPKRICVHFDSLIAEHHLVPLLPNHHLSGDSQ